MESQRSPGRALTGLAVTVVAGILAMIALLAVRADAAGSDGPPPYTVDAYGITLPAGDVWSDGGGINIHATGSHTDVHFEEKCINKSDAECAGNLHNWAQYIGKSFIPWSAFGLSDRQCVSWTQLDTDKGYNEHYGEGGQQPVCVGTPTLTPTTPTPTPTVTPTRTPTPTPTPTETTTPTPTPTPTKTTSSPTPTPTPTVTSPTTPPVPTPTPTEATPPPSGSTPSNPSSPTTPKPTNPNHPTTVETGVAGKQSPAGHGPLIFGSLGALVLLVASGVLYSRRHQASHRA